MCSLLTSVDQPFSNEHDCSGDVVQSRNNEVASCINLSTDVYTACYCTQLLFVCTDHDDVNEAKSPNLVWEKWTMSVDHSQPVRWTWSASEGAAHLDGVAVAVLGVAERLNKGKRGVVGVKCADVAGGGRIAGVEQCLQAADDLLGQTCPCLSLPQYYQWFIDPSTAGSTGTSGIAATHAHIPELAIRGCMQVEQCLKKRHSHRWVFGHMQAESSRCWHEHDNKRGTVHMHWQFSHFTGASKVDREATRCTPAGSCSRQAAG